jgi:hypothetical protein
MTVTSSTLALELVHRGGDEVVAYACPSCGTVITPTSFGDGQEGQEVARALALEHCNRHCRCSKPIPSNRIICDTCWEADQRVRDLKKFELAEKVYEDGYGAPVYWEGKVGSMGDGYFSGIDEVREHCEDEDEDVPVYVWACNPVDLHIDVDNILESAFQEHYEGARDMLNAEAEEELSLFLNAWCKRQNIRSWQPDFRKAILLDRPDGEGEDPEYCSEGPG